MSKWPRYSKCVDTWYQVQACLCETKTGRYQEGPTLQVTRMPWSVDDERTFFFSSEKRRTGISSTAPVDERYHRAAQALCTTLLHFRRYVAAAAAASVGRRKDPLGDACGNTCFLRAVTKGKRGRVDFYYSFSMPLGNSVLAENGCGQFSSCRWIHSKPTSQ